MSAVPARRRVRPLLAVVLALGLVATSVTVVLLALTGLDVLHRGETVRGWAILGTAVVLLLVEATLILTAPRPLDRK